MKTLGIILIILGIVMIFFTQINYTKKEKVIDAGPLQVNKTENRTINWPTYAGIGVAAIGAVLLIGARSKKA